MPDISRTIFIIQTSVARFKRQHYFLPNTVSISVWLLMSGNLEKRDSQLAETSSASRLESRTPVGESLYMIPEEVEAEEIDVWGRNIWENPTVDAQAVSLTRMQRSVKSLPFGTIHDTPGLNYLLPHESAKTEHWMPRFWLYILQSHLTTTHGFLRVTFIQISPKLQSWSLSSSPTRKHPNFYGLSL